MQNIIHFGKPCPIDARGSAVVIGNFDGVHLGHQALIKAGFATGLRVTVLSFDPHPKSFFNQKPVFHLSTFEEKRNILEKLGVTTLAMCNFTKDFAALAPEDFIDKVLVNWLGAKAVITGDNFKFGHKREGDTTLLSSQFFKFIAVAPILFAGLPVSSSRIREALRQGQIEQANLMLARDYSVSGEVLPGQKIGRDLGYPTANMVLSPENELKHGIYAVRVDVEGEIFGGVASYGRRPMFDNGAPLLETHLFDFKGDLYGKTLRVFFVDYLRGEAVFDGLPALIKQMDEDCKKSRLILLAKSNANH